MNNPALVDAGGSGQNTAGQVKQQILTPAELVSLRNWIKKGAAAKDFKGRTKIRSEIKRMLDLRYMQTIPKQKSRPNPNYRSGAIKLSAAAEQCRNSRGVGPSDEWFRCYFAQEKALGFTTGVAVFAIFDTLISIRDL